MKRLIAIVGGTEYVDDRSDVRDIGLDGLELCSGTKMPFRPPAGWHGVVGQFGSSIRRLTLGPGLYSAEILIRSGTEVRVAGPKFATDQVAAYLNEGGLIICSDQWFEDTAGQDSSAAKVQIVLSRDEPIIRQRGSYGPVTIT